MCSSDLLDEVIDEVIRAARVVAGTKSVSVDANVVASAAFTGDEELIRRMVANLVDNAVRHAAGTVVVRLRQCDDEAVLEVEDDGPGLPPGFALGRDAGVGLDVESMSKLFDAFYTTKVEGMGIGLSVSRSIIEKHHGRLWAEPNDGPGATFSFSIPAVPEILAGGSTVAAS